MGSTEGSVRDERGTSTGRHTQRGVHPGVGRQAPELGRQRPAFRRLGGLPRQRLGRRPQPALCVAVQRLVRAGDSALQRRRQNLGARREQVRVRGRCRHAPMVRRHAAPVGVQAGLASRAIANRSRYGLRRSGRRRPLPYERRRAELAGASRAARPRLSRRVAAGRGRVVPSHNPAGPCRPRADLRRHLGGGRVPDRRCRPDVAADQSRTEVAGDPRSGRRGRPLCAPPRDAPFAPPRAVHAKALGRHAQRRRRRVVARGQRQPAERLRVRDGRARARAGDRLRRPDQERFGALSARRQAARVPEPYRRARVGTADQRLAAARLLRQRVEGRDGGRHARLVRRVFRDHRRPGVRVGRCRRHLGAHRPGSSAGAFD